MQETRLADYDHPIVAEKASQLAADAPDSRSKIARVFEYVRDGVEFGFPKKGDMVKASDTIASGVGQCNTKSTLFVALCKAMGIQARVHFSLITKDIQRGLFTGIAYRSMPKLLSHSWVEVFVDGSWRRVDSFINDMDFYNAGREELKRRGWQTGFSISCAGGAPSAELSLDEERFVQMGAVVDDHGVYDDPLEYFLGPLYRNRPGVVKLLLYRLLIGGVNRRVESLRYNELVSRPESR